MRIPRIHVDTELAAGATIALPQAQTHYLKHVLRLKPGARLRLFNGREDHDFGASLVADGKGLGAALEGPVAVDTESPLDCEILQGLGRGDHMDWMIQKSTELGVTRIQLFNAARTQSPPRPAQLEKKLHHWRGVAISACEQCGRARLPEIHFQAQLQAAIEACRGERRVLLDFTGRPLADVLADDKRPVALLLGPEGGLDSAEVAAAEGAGFIPARLGPRVLRTETAAVAALAITQARVGDLR